MAQVVKVHIAEARYAIGYVTSNSRTWVWGRYAPSLQRWIRKELFAIYLMPSRTTRTGDGTFHGLGPQFRTVSLALLSRSGRYRLCKRVSTVIQVVQISQLTV